MEDEIQVRDLEEARMHIQVLRENLVETQRRLRRVEKMLDTGWETPVWKRIVFWIDGWPLNRLVDEPAWRPWRRWWTS